MSQPKYFLRDLCNIRTVLALVLVVTTMYLVYTLFDISWVTGLAGGVLLLPLCYSYLAACAYWSTMEPKRPVSLTSRSLDFVLDPRVRLWWLWPVCAVFTSLTLGTADIIAGMARTVTSIGDLLPMAVACALCFVVAVFSAFWIVGTLGEREALVLANSSK